jgi:hypothetical protein
MSPARIRYHVRSSLERGTEEIVSRAREIDRILKEDFR